MGFLENLLKKEARKIVSNVVDSVVDNVVDNVTGNIRPNRDIEQSSDEYNTGAMSSITDDSRRRKKEMEMSGLRRIHTRLTEIVAEQWPDYELKQNVPASVFGADMNTRNYSYIIYKNGAPVLSIMVLDNSNHYRRNDVVAAHEASVGCGVPCINIMTYLPSERSYIYGRLKEFLG